MRFKKKILLDSRTYHSPGGKVVVDSEKLKHWEDKFNTFQQKGFDIPVVWGHPDDLEKNKPIKRKGKRRLLPQDNAGWMTGFKVQDDGKGAEIELNIPRPTDAERVEANLVEVSPVIWEKLVDGSDEKHENVIGACDLVLHPVDNTQTPFEPVDSIACSLRMGLESGEPQIYRLADEAMEEGSDDTSGDRIRRVVEALASMKIVLSDDTNADNLLEHLEQALLTAAAITEEDSMENTEDTKPEVAQMSLEQQKRLDQADNAFKFAEKQHQDGVAVQLSLLLETGRVTPAEAEEKTKEVAAVRLSLDSDGNHTPSALESFIESRKAVPQGTFWTDEERTTQMGLEDTKHPDVVSGEAVSDEEADAVADAVFGVKK